MFLVMFAFVFYVLRQYVMNSKKETFESVLSQAEQDKLYDILQQNQTPIAISPNDTVGGLLSKFAAQLSSPIASSGTVSTSGSNVAPAQATQMSQNYQNYLKLVSDAMKSGASGSIPPYNPSVTYPNPSVPAPGITSPELGTPETPKQPLTGGTNLDTQDVQKPIGNIPDGSAPKPNEVITDDSKMNPPAVEPVDHTNKYPLIDTQQKQCSNTYTMKFPYKLPKEAGCGVNNCANGPRNYKNPANMDDAELDAYKKIKDFSRMTLTDYIDWLLLFKQNFYLLETIHIQNLTRLLRGDILQVSDIPGTSMMFDSGLPYIREGSYSNKQANDFAYIGSNYANYNDYVNPNNIMSSNVFSRPRRDVLENPEEKKANPQVINGFFNQNQ